MTCFVVVAEEVEEEPVGGGGAHEQAQGGAPPELVTHPPPCPPPTRHRETASFTRITTRLKNENRKTDREWFRRRRARAQNPRALPLDRAPLPTGEGAREGQLCLDGFSSENLKWIGTWKASPVNFRERIFSEAADSGSPY